MAAGGRGAAAAAVGGRGVGGASGANPAPVEGRWAQVSAGIHTYVRIDLQHLNQLFFVAINVSFF